MSEKADDTSNKTQEPEGDAAGAAAAGNAAEQAAGAASGIETDKQGADDKATPKTFTQAEVDRMVAKSLKEAKKAADDAAAKAKLSEDERKDAEIGELRQQIRMRDAKDAVTAALKKEGGRNVELMFAAIRGDLEFDDKGKLANLESLVNDLKADHSDLFGVAKPEGGADGGAGSKEKPSTLTKESLEKMSPDEINKLDWAEVQKVLTAK